MEKEELWDLKWLCRNLWLDHKKVENQFSNYEGDWEEYKKNILHVCEDDYMIAGKESEIKRLSRKLDIDEEALTDSIYQHLSNVVTDKESVVDLFLRTYLQFHEDVDVLTLVESDAEHTGRRFVHAYFGQEECTNNIQRLMVTFCKTHMLTPMCLWKYCANRISEKGSSVSLHLMIYSHWSEAVNAISKEYASISDIDRDNYLHDVTQRLPILEFHVRRIVKYPDYTIKVWKIMGMTEVDIAAVLQLGDCSYQDQQIGVYAYQKNMSYDEALDEIYSHIPRECRNTYGNTKEEVAWGYWNEYKEKMGICLNKSLNKCDDLMRSLISHEEESSQASLMSMEQYAEDPEIKKSTAF